MSPKVLASFFIFLSDYLLSFFFFLNGCMVLSTCFIPITEVSGDNQNTCSPRGADYIMWKIDIGKIDTCKIATVTRVSEKYKVHNWTI